MGKTSELPEATLRTKGIQALNQALGAAGAYRFLCLVQREPTDYVKISRQQHRGMSVDQIFLRGRKGWAKSQGQPLRAPARGRR